jgi:hypothetical protein
MMALSFVVLDESVHVVDIHQHSPALSHFRQLPGPNQMSYGPAADSEIATGFFYTVEPLV